MGSHRGRNCGRGSADQISRDTTHSRGRVDPRDRGRTAPDAYQERRGLYFDIRKELPGSDEENEVIDMVKKHDWNKELDMVVRFQEKYETVYGNGTINSLNLIYDNIQ